MDVKLVVQKGPTRTKAIRIHHKHTFIGRSPKCNVRILSAEISRQHCRLDFRDGFLSVTDLDSANGTFLNGRRIQGCQVVRPGDRLEIGPVTFMAEYTLSTEAHAQMESAQAADAGGDVSIIEGVPLDDMPLEGGMNPPLFDSEEVLEGLALGDEERETAESEAVQSGRVSAKNRNADDPIPFDQPTDEPSMPQMNLPEPDQLRDLLAQMDGIDSEAAPEEPPPRPASKRKR